MVSCFGSCRRRVFKICFPHQPIEVINESDKQELIKIRNYFGEHDKMTSREDFAWTDEANNLKSINPSSKVSNKTKYESQKATLINKSIIPNGIDLKKLSELLMFSDKYEISIQFWPQQLAVFIAKDGVDLTDFGGDFDFAINKSIEYLQRITKS